MLAPIQSVSSTSSVGADVNEIKGNERVLESKQMAQKHKEDKAAHHENTVAKAQLDLKPMSTDQMVDMFDSL